MTVQTDKILIEKVLKSPGAYIVIDKVQAKLQQEKQKRTNFYKEITEQEKAEFINGEVIVHSPVQKFHNEITGNLYKIISTYVIEHKLGFVGIEKILLKFTRNDYEPDICFFNKNKADKFSEDQMFFPVPDMIIEVLSKSTEKRDRGIKFEDYQNHGVEEYWIIDPKSKIVEQYSNKNQQFELVLKSNSGELTSEVITNLKLPIEAIFDSVLAHQYVKSIV